MCGRRGRRARWWGSRRPAPIGSPRPRPPPASPAWGPPGRREPLQTGCGEHPAAGTHGPRALSSLRTSPCPMLVLSRVNGGDWRELCRCRCARLAPACLRLPPVGRPQPLPGRVCSPKPSLLSRLRKERLSWHGRTISLLLYLGNGGDRDQNPTEPLLVLHGGCCRGAERMEQRGWEQCGLCCSPACSPCVAVCFVCMCSVCPHVLRMLMQTCAHTRVVCVCCMCAHAALCVFHWTRVL